MHADQLPYRQLYDALLSYDGGAPYDDLLRPWLAAADGERRWLDTLRARRGEPARARRWFDSGGAREGSPVPAVAPEELCRLYALSRIVELLQLSFAPPAEARAWDVAAIGPGEHARFMEGLGLERVDRAGFHPFHHEIVAVDETPDDDASPAIVQTYWPCWMLGPLLVTRAGVRVAAGRAHVRKEIAERSTLYWAFARNGRPTADLANGWGGNSQWRTGFRRDYALDGMLHYNVDAAPVRGGGPAEDGLDEAEWRELLRHRCFVTCAKPHDDRWPYDLTMREPAG